MQTTFSGEVFPFLFATDETASTAVRASDAESPAEKTVLVVDDDMDIRILVQILMQTSGYRVLTANDGIHALEEVIRETPDLILLDIGMPHIDGLHVLRLIRANEPTADVPIVLVTAHGSAADIEAGLEAGANHYITKPFEAEKLIEVVQQLLASNA